MELFYIELLVFENFYLSAVERLNRTEIAIQNGLKFHNLFGRGSKFMFQHVPVYNFGTRRSG